MRIKCDQYIRTERDYWAKEFEKRYGTKDLVICQDQDDNGYSYFDVSLKHKDIFIRISMESEHYV